MRLFRRTRFTLCDETPPVDHSRCTTCGGLLGLIGIDRVGLQWVHAEKTGDGHAPVVEPPERTAKPDAQTVRIEASLPDAIDLDHAHYHRADLLSRHALETRYLDVCQRLREITGDRDRLEQVNDTLRERIRGLELTVASLRTPGETLQMPRVRSMPAPGGGR